MKNLSMTIPFEQGELKMFKLFICIIIFYVLSLPANISAELSSGNYEIIKLAFMNGYIHCINVEIDTIEELKEDKDKMEAFVHNAMVEYMEKVVQLNYSDPRGKSEKKNPIQSNNSMLL